MKKTLIAAICILVFGAFLVVPMTLWADGAVIVRDFDCTLLDGDGNFVVANGIIEVHNDDGVTMLKCKAKGLANSTGAAVVWSIDNTGLPCNTTAYGSTDVWSETVSASGNATLTCIIE